MPHTRTDNKSHCGEVWFQVPLQMKKSLDFIGVFYENNIIGDLGWFVEYQMVQGFTGTMVQWYNGIMVT